MSAHITFLLGVCSRFSPHRKLIKLAHCIAGCQCNRCLAIAYWHLQPDQCILSRFFKYNIHLAVE